MLNIMFSKQMLNFLNLIKIQMFMEKFLLGKITKMMDINEEPQEQVSIKRLLTVVETNNEDEVQ